MVLSHGILCRSVLGRVRALELQLQAVGDEGDEFGICRLALGVGYGIAEEPLEGVQVPSVPGHLDGVADGALHTGGRGLECFRHLGVQYLRDGVDDVHIVDGDDGVLSARRGGYQEQG